MPLPNTAAFFLIHVKLIGAATQNKPADQINYKVVAYMPGYDGKLSGLMALPYREKLTGNIYGGLREISWGKTPSLLPGECSSQASPFPSGVTFRFLIDSQLAERNSATGTLIGFGQLAGTTDARNLSVYNVASKDQKIVTVANAFEVYVHHVITNGNIPQPL